MQLIATVTLNAPDKAFFNTKGGKIGIWTTSAPGGHALGSFLSKMTQGAQRRSL